MNTFRFPHPLVLLVGFIVLATLLSYVLPAGIFERRTDAATGREVVVPGSYHRVAPSPVSPLEAVVSIPRGLQEAASVIFFVFLTGGAFTVVDYTGALRRGVDWLLARFRGREALVIPLISLLFATMGALENMQEEIIPLVPVLLVLMRRLGYPVLTAAAVSLGAAAVGAAFSPINPFQVGIAQKLAQLPLLSGAGFRLIFLAAALALWIGGTMRYAARHRIAPETAEAETEAAGGAGRHGLVLLLLLLTFAAFTYGVLNLGWEFEQMGALFFVLGVAAGLVGGLGLTGTAESFIAGFRDLAFSALLIGFARAIFVVLEQGQIVDTIVQGLSAPLAGLPVTLSALGMMAVHTTLHLPVPSVSGQAVLTMPILTPLSDLLGLSRQVTVLAYQYGAGLCELITPTNGALMAIVAACGVRFDAWWKFALPLYLGLLVLGALAVVIGIAVGLQ
ncbi:C4-dicarboxylate anaerobic carrier [Hymenobacter roseosalivarius DSM 11622]|uniref:C4-dicarboxylate anaerobic carrier n=1 Tax=Hymenobacter roseosalivarius DSM 11622 TaxID=645990 RepID=A0A1W1VX29_9BACT|nr:YfcC family protein [Hymenobacter roseosalivarius]SMB97932.1 C4-dicarboxylate anaerobic carrier [Hymenobacter roseosalivarius DSM 11622]